MKRTVLLWLLVTVTAIGADDAGRIVLRKGRLTLAVGEAEKGAIVSLVDDASGVEFAAAQKTPRLFALTLSKKAEVPGDRFILTSADAKQFTMSVKRDAKEQVATLDYNGLGDWPVRVSCTASATVSDRFVRWRIAVMVPEGLVLEAVKFPIVVLRAPLGASVDDDAAVVGATKGGVIRQPGAMRVGSTVTVGQPGNMAAQFGCYYDARAGFHTAAHDGKGYPKTLSIGRVAEGVEIGWSLPCFATGSVEPDYAVVMTTFHRTGSVPADWRDSADIYKEWALRQPWCATTYDKRKDIPAWMKAGPAMVRFGREWLAEPAQIEKWLAEYWKKNFPDAPLITAYWGWEKIGGWVTPDYFPVFPSDGQFTNLVARTRGLGCHAFPWPSGYHWTLMYRKQDDGSFYWDDRKRFDEVARPHAVVERNGKVYAHDRSWLAGGQTSCMCPGDPWTVRWWNNDISAPLARRGCEMIQVDQVVGGGFPFCYSREHAHPPGPGLWMTEVFTKQLRTMFAACRKIESDAVVCVEEPNEWFNHLVGIQDYRDCESPNEWASVFNYLYHEFLPTFQSNPRGGDRLMAAYCLVNGQIPHLTPTMRIGKGPVLATGDFEEWVRSGNTITGWQQVRSYQGRVWNGKASHDETEKHGGTASLRLDNTADGDTVQVSQNVMVGDGGFTVGKRCRLSAWMKTGELAKPNAIRFGLFAPGLKWLAGGSIALPAAGAGWTRGAAEFTVPAGAEMLRVMIHVEGRAKVWVDDVTLEELRPDGTAAVVMRSPTPRDHEFMRRWVELYHGEGRPWLQFGRMLHPPRLECGTVRSRSGEMPAVLHNAFRAPDGREAVVLANATYEPQTATLQWKGRRLEFDLKPADVVLVE
ncbi:MAG: hypothetical protein HZA91_18090 [Verrucomicrobia bacterium]|nr:hypothetical protein [Verrucomicrobiota bacterium]